MEGDVCFFCARAISALIARSAIGPESCLLVMLPISNHQSRDILGIRFFDWLISGTRVNMGHYGKRDQNIYVF